MSVLGKTCEELWEKYAIIGIDKRRYRYQRKVSILFPSLLRTTIILFNEIFFQNSRTEVRFANFWKRNFENFREIFVEIAGRNFWGMFQLRQIFFGISWKIRTKIENNCYHGPLRWAFLVALKLGAPSPQQGGDQKTRSEFLYNLEHESI